MKITEKVLIVLAIIAVYLNINLIDGGALLTLISFLLLALFYVLFGFALFNKIGFRKIFHSESYKTAQGVELVMGLLLGISISSAIIGLLFKLNIWHGAPVISLVAVYVWIFMLLILGIATLVSKTSFIKRAWPRLLVYSILVAAAFYSNSVQIDKIKYRNHPEQLQQLYR